MMVSCDSENFQVWENITWSTLIILFIDISKDSIKFIDEFQSRVQIMTEELDSH